MTIPVIQFGVQGPAGPTQSLVFQPGGTAGGNVYTTWATLAAAMAITTGPKTVLVDSTLATAHMTVGAAPWNLDNCTFAPIWNSDDTLFIDDGAHFTCGRLELVGGMIFSGAASVAANIPMTSSAAFAAIFLREGSTLVSTTAQPVVHVTAGFFNLNAFEASIVGDAVHPVISTDGAFLGFFCFEDSQVKANAVSGAGAAATAATIDASSVYSASGVVTLIDNASRVAFAPAINANWQPVPTQVKAALDQLAASNTISAVGNTGTGGGTVTVVTGNITKKKNGQMTVSASCLLTTSAAASTLTVQLKRDAANIGTAKTLAVPASGIVTGLDVSIDAIDTAPDNAAHTYTLSVSVSAGTLTVAANSAQIQVVEDS